MRSAPIIEFAGLPGAGKTTIARAALAELEGLGLRCYCNESLANRHVVHRRKSPRVSGKLRTLGRLALSSIRYRRVAFDLVRCIAHTRSRSLASLTRAANLLILLDDLRAIPAGRYDVILLDQGLVQYIWSIFVAGGLPPDQHLRRLLATIFEEVPLTIIFVEIDAAAAASRIGRRETQASRFDEFSPARVQAYLSKYKVVFGKIRCWSVEPPRTNSLDIDGSRPVDHNVRRIVPFVAGLLPAGRGARARVNT